MSKASDANALTVLITVNSTSIKAFTSQYLISIPINQENCTCLKVGLELIGMDGYVHLFEQQNYDELLYTIFHVILFFSHRMFYF